MVLILKIQLRRFEAHYLQRKRKSYGTTIFSAVPCVVPRPKQPDEICF